MHGFERFRLLRLPVIRHQASAAVRRRVEIDDPARVHCGEADALVIERQGKERVRSLCGVVQICAHERRRAVGRIVADRGKDRVAVHGQIGRILVFGNDDFGLQRLEIGVVQGMIGIRVARRFRRRNGRGGGRRLRFAARIRVVRKPRKERHAVAPDREAERGKQPQPEQDLEIGRNAESFEPDFHLFGGVVPLFVLHAAILLFFRRAVNRHAAKGHCETETNVLYCNL